LVLSARNYFGSAQSVFYSYFNTIAVAFMFILPMGFEIFSEQSKILNKIQMQMANEAMMGGAGDMGPPQMRPF
jgi:hypothetical protein